MSTKRFSVGDKVQYRSIKAGIILGVVTGFGRDQLGDYVAWRVTSKTNTFYPRGTLDFSSLTDAYLQKRSK